MHWYPHFYSTDKASNNCYSSWRCFSRDFPSTVGHSSIFQALSTRTTSVLKVGPQIDVEYITIQLIPSGILKSE